MDQNMEANDPKNNRKGAGEEQVELLSTKLAPPQLRAPFVPREALLDRLSDGVEQKLTLISAPAGFGKTTLVAEWVESLKSVESLKLKVEGARKARLNLQSSN